MASYYDIIGEKTDILTELLTERFAQYGYSVREEYAEINAEYPVNIPVLTVGIHSLKSGDSDCGAFLGKHADTNLNAFARSVSVTYRVTVHTSAQYAYNVCRSSAAIVAEACHGIFDVREVVSGEPKYDRQCRCVTMPIDVTVRYLLG